MTYKDKASCDSTPPCTHIRQRQFLSRQGPTNSLFYFPATTRTHMRLRLIWDLYPCSTKSTRTHMRLRLIWDLYPCSTNVQQMRLIPMFNRYETYTHVQRRRFTLRHMRLRFIWDLYPCSTKTSYLLHTATNCNRLIWDLYPCSTETILFETVSKRIGAHFMCTHSIHIDLRHIHSIHIHSMRTHSIPIHQRHIHSLDAHSLDTHSSETYLLTRCAHNRRTKRFNLKKIPPPPPILNPYIYETSITYLSDICQTCIT